MVLFYHSSDLGCVEFPSLFYSQGLVFYCVFGYNKCREAVYAYTWDSVGPSAALVPACSTQPFHAYYAKLIVCLLSDHANLAFSVQRMQGD